MSAYWAGYAGTGMVLRENEFEAFLEKYKKKNPGCEEELDDYLEDGDIEEYKFLKSVFAGKQISNLQDSKDHEDKAIYFCKLTDDHIEGLRLWPFYRADGSMNLSEKKEDGTWDTETILCPMWDNNSSCYVLFSEKSFTSPRVFERPAYASYEEFKQEFMDNVAAYMPEDFDWDAHLGYLSYACFA